MAIYVKIEGVWPRDQMLDSCAAGEDAILNEDTTRNVWQHQIQTESETFFKEFIVC